MLRQQYFLRLVVATYCSLEIQLYANRYASEIDDIDTSFLDFLNLMGIGVPILSAMAFAFKTSISKGKNGFPLPLLFLRPLRNWVIATIPLSIFGVLCSLLYLIPIFILNTFLGTNHPLIPISILLLVLAVVCAGCSWWTNDKLYRSISWALVIITYCAYVVVSSANSPLQKLDLENYDLTILDYIAAIIGLLTIAALTIHGVDRQRHGDFSPDSQRANWKDGYLPNILMRIKKMPIFQCPTSSISRAEAWFEMRVSGISVLTLGFSFSLLVFLVFNAIDYFVPENPLRQFSSLNVPSPAFPFLILLIVVLFVAPLYRGTKNLYGIYRDRGNGSLSLYNATRPIGTAHSAGLHSLISIFCIFSAWSILGASVWLSAHLLNDLYNLAPMLTNISTNIDSYSRSTFLALIIVGVTQLLTLVATFATFQVYVVLNRRNTMLILAGIIGILAYGVMLRSVLKIEWSLIVVSHMWITLAIILPLTIYLLFDSIRKKNLTSGLTAYTLGFWSIYVLAYFFIMYSNSILNANSPLTAVMWTILVSALPLTAIGGTLHTLHRYRHVG